MLSFFPLSGVRHSEVAPTPVAHGSKLGCQARGRNRTRLHHRRIPIVLSRSMLLKLKNTYIEMAFILCFPLTHSSLRVIRLLRPGFGDGHYICSAPAVRHAAGKINQPEPSMIVITCFFTTVSISEVPNILRGIASYLLARMPEPGIRRHSRELVIRLRTFQVAVYLSSEGVEIFQTNSTSSIKTANLPT